MELEEQVEKLTKETMAFRKEMLIMKGLLKQQNNLLRDLIDINQKTLRVPQYKNCALVEVDVTFPLATVEDLEYLESALEDNATKEMITVQISRIVGDKTLTKRLDHVLSMDVILDFNVDGLKNKRRLLDYPNFMDAFFKGARQADWTNDKFIDELRQSIRKCKCRYFKSSARQKEKRKLAEDDEEML